MAAMNPDEIISILKEEIKNYDEISKDQEVGTVISVGDGIATVHGSHLRESHVRLVHDK